MCQISAGICSLHSFFHFEHGDDSNAAISPFLQVFHYVWEKICLTDLAPHNFLDRLRKIKNI